MFWYKINGLWIKLISFFKKVLEYFMLFIECVWAIIVLIYTHLKNKRKNNIDFKEKLTKIKIKKEKCLVWYYRIKIIIFILYALFILLIIISIINSFVINEIKIPFINAKITLPDFLREIPNN